MPHITVEYTNNIETKVHITELMKKINASLIAEKDGTVFAPQAIRTRAIKLDNYVTAEGNSEDAFIHVTVKIAPGRSGEVKKCAHDHLFDVLETHVKETMQNQPVVYSIEFNELSKDGDMYKQGNISS